MRIVFIGKRFAVEWGMNKNKLKQNSKTKYPAVWSIESTGGGCQWLRNGQLAITDGEAGLPVCGKPCSLLTLKMDGSFDERGTVIKYGSPEAVFVDLEAMERIYGQTSEAVNQLTRKTGPTKGGSVK